MGIFGSQPAKRTISAIAALAVTACLLAVGAAARPATPSPQNYYLALGDSVAYGAQPTKMNAPPSGFNSGYVDVFAGRLRTIAPKIQVVNYSCPGESTRTFVKGGCSGRGDVKGLHDPYKGAQLAAALAFLRAHPGRVSPITLTLWGNDVVEVADACKGDPGCIQARAPHAFAQLGARLATIVEQLRAAAPNAEIIVTGAWNFNVGALPQTDPLFRSVDRSIARAAAAGKAQVAKLFPVFNPKGSVAREKARLCAMTFICKGDVHPTNAGYRAIAAAVWTASGFGRG